MRRWIVFTSLKINRWKLAWLWATNVSSHNFQQKRFYTMMTFWRTTESFYMAYWIPISILVISYRWTVLSYFVPTKTRPTYICTRCNRAIWAFGGWVVYCTTHGRFSTCFHLKFAIYFLIKAEIIDNTYDYRWMLYHSVVTPCSM
jgi:hypothetical protein